MTEAVILRCYVFLYYVVHGYEYQSLSLRSIIAIV